jgi:hypothetical protein
MLRSHSWSTKTCFFFNLRCEKHEETYPQLISYFKIIYKRWWSTAEIYWRNFAPFHKKIEGNTTKTKNILGFFRKETYDALIFTSEKTAVCVRYLLLKCNFKFVLTNKFPTDNIERMFGAIWSIGRATSLYHFRNQQNSTHEHLSQFSS